MIWWGVVLIITSLLKFKFMKKIVLGLSFFTVLSLNFHLNAKVLPPGEDPLPKQCIDVRYQLKGAWLKCGEISGGPEGGTVKFGIGCTEGLKNFCESTCTNNCYQYLAPTPTPQPD